MRIIKLIVLGMGLLIMVNQLHAQITLQSERTDSIVSVAAESLGLSQIAREDLPRGGTYWWVQPGGQAVPTPFPSPNLNQSIYQITDGQFLVDQTGGAVVVPRRQLGSRTATDNIATAATAQANAVVNLINQVLDAEDNRQMQSMMRSMGIDVPSPVAVIMAVAETTLTTTLPTRLTRIVCGWK